MVIAHFASDFYPNLGGVQEFVRQLTRAQAARGHAPLIFTNRWPKTLPAREVYEGVPVFRTVFRVPGQSWKQWRQWTGAAVCFAPTLWRLAHALREARAEVLHIQCAGPNATYALFLHRLLGLPLVATLHGELSVDNDRIFQKSALARRRLRAVLREAEMVTACSHHTLREAEEFFGASLGGRGEVIYNGVCNDEFASALPFAHRRPYFLAIGRHVRQKGFDLLLHAFARLLHSTEADHDLVLAGDGPERAGLERTAEMLGIRERVRFTGAADRQMTARLFAGCSFFVLPSRMEPLGIVNLEAMASGKPVLAARVGGVPEIVGDGGNGLLVEPENVEALTLGLARMFADRDLRHALGRAGRERARCFDWSNVAAKYDAVYETARATRRRFEKRSGCAFGSRGDAPLDYAP